MRKISSLLILIFGIIALASCTNGKPTVSESNITNMSNNLLGVDIKNDSSEMFPYYYAGCEVENGKIYIYITENSDKIKNDIKAAYKGLNTIEFIEVEFNLNQLYKTINDIKNKTDNQIANLTDVIDCKTRITATELNLKENRFYIHVKNLTDLEKKELTEEFKDYLGLEFIEAKLVSELL